MSQHLVVKTFRATPRSLPAVIALTAVTLALYLGPVSTAEAYTGSLNNISSPAGIKGTGNWTWSPTKPVTLSWSVTQLQSGLWHYAYTFTHERSATSHFILETCADLVKAEVLNATGDFASFSVGNFSKGSGNPGMPASVYGIKFSGTTGNSTFLAFDSYREPAWKDFYAKGGTAGGHGQNAAWNAGFTASDSDPSEDTAATDGSVENHVLSLGCDPVPEPGTMLLMGMGLIGAAGMARRRRKGAEQN
ncbi:MAG: PEP-CTERM sorting domain-containing protein [Candidatus Eisenbacteria bacterium]|nr:PEP-CTERM sorting domain-containing protein [Candidatus Eisenbacteria bacterium]